VRVSQIRREGEEGHEARRLVRESKCARAQERRESEPPLPPRRGHARRHSAPAALARPARVRDAPDIFTYKHHEPLLRPRWSQRGPGCERWGSSTRACWPSSSWAGARAGARAARRKRAWRSSAARPGASAPARSTSRAWSATRRGSWNARGTFLRRGRGRHSPRTRSCSQVRAT